MNKRTIKEIILGLVCISLSYSGYAQKDNVHQRSSEYQAPVDPLVKAKLEDWRDQKFGILIHWGIYSVPGIIESWSICSEDWIERDSTIAYNDYKKWYWNLEKVFNPVNFDPDQWAEAAESAGMKYLVFTTKHHDGFNMFDTQQTDYKITAGPFKNHPKANVTKHIFEAFRKKDFMIGAYFSKPDWHSQYYWWDKYATPNRNNNYDINRYPWRWNKFKEFTFNQLNELMTDYGSIDVLWLDGGWVRPKETVNDEVRAWGAPIPEWSQDIDMDKIAAMAREAQPGIIFADRTVHGPYENYQTPERKIPDEKLEDPWESCLPLGDNWGYVPNDNFKTSEEVIHNLVEVVAKGGNMLLGIGPKSDGTFPLDAVAVLEEIGEWLEKNGEAIYSTRTLGYYKDGTTYFTQKEGKKYAIVLMKKEKEAPKMVSWKGNLPKKGSKLKLLETGEVLKWQIKNNEVIVNLPSDYEQVTPALAFSFN
jgi:alpha-L-fucosidase